MRRIAYLSLVVAGAVVVGAAPVAAQPDSSTSASAGTVTVGNDSVMIRFADADIRAVIRALGRYLLKPVLVGAIPATRLPFFSTPTPLPVARIPGILKGIVEAHGLRFSEDSTFYRIVPGNPGPSGPQSRLAGRRGPPPEPVHLHTVRLRHAIAADVAATLDQLFGGAGAFAGRSGLSMGTLSDELRRDAGRATQPAVAEPGTPGGQVGARNATLIGDVTIVPDELTNSLLIRATDPDFDLLADGIAELDIRPLQVLIEMVVVEARRDREFSLGLDLSIPPQGVAGGTVQGDLTGAGLGDLVVQVMKLGRYEINARLAAARRRGDVHILSRPVLVTSNNSEAHLLVGTQQPFVQVSRSLPTDAPQRDQVVQYRDVGTKLTVRPTINDDGYVNLVIQQEISAATGQTQFDAPVISTRETLTRILVADGQTMVLGGLTDRQEDRVRTGIPLLADLPLVGGLFGSTSTRSTATELFLFITPTILRTDEDADAVTAPRLPPEVDGGTAPVRPDSVPPANPRGHAP